MLTLINKNNLPYNKNNKALLMKKIALNNNNLNITKNQIKFKDKVP